VKQKYTIAILGGTGAQGGGLGLRWAKAGHQIIVGSRDVEKAEAKAAAIRETLGIQTVSGETYERAASKADIIALTVPHSVQRSTIEQAIDGLHGKIIIDATVPLVPPKVARVQLPPEGSAVASLQRWLGDKARVVAAFQNVSAHHLSDLEHPVECDVLVCGDDVAAREVVIGLARDAGLDAYHAGPIENAVAVEALTSLLIAINIRYKAPGSGIRITRVPTHTVHK